MPEPRAVGGDADLAARCEEVERLAASGEAAAGDLLALRLSDPSWYLRERVVAALGARSDATSAILTALRDGEWWARASACDVLARRGHASALEDLLDCMEDRNVSLQKSAARAIAAIAERSGAGPLAERLAALPPVRRRRVLARLGHQVPQWVEVLDRELATVPPERFAVAAPAAQPSEISDATRTRRLRSLAWLMTRPPRRKTGVSAASAQRWRGARPVGRARDAPDPPAVFVRAIRRSRARGRDRRHARVSRGWKDAHAAPPAEEGLVAGWRTTRPRTRWTRRDTIAQLGSV
jgi:hypothetical protein